MAIQLFTPWCEWLRTVFSLVVCKVGFKKLGHILVGSRPDDKNQDFMHWLVKYKFDLKCFEGKNYSNFQTAGRDLQIKVIQNCIQPNMF